MNRADLLRAAALCLTLLPAGAGARADFAAGARAYDGGDYRTAFSEWMALARAGDVEAQVAVAGLYRYGAGRRIDLPAAALWYRRAARAGDAIAQANLGEMYLKGTGVGPDRVQALIWLTRAARAGNAWAADQKARLEKSLDRDELARARQALREAPLPGATGLP